MDNGRAKDRVNSAYSERLYRGLRILTFPELHEKAAEIVSRLLPPGAAILDVAAGEGGLSERLIDAGYKVSCTSWNNKVRVQGAEVFGIDLDKDFDRKDVGGREYDCVLCIEIIEHLESPSAFLRKVFPLVADNGYVLLSTPNIESAMSRLQILLRGYPLLFSGDEIKLNRHISMMNHQVLEFLFERVGFRILEKHFLPLEFVRVGTLRSLGKCFLVKTLKLAMQGDREGVCRFYVLAKGKPAPAAPTDFY
jgi:cyclopropane fatty-acyl-phospholipid synthase-like methyltransferase